MKKKFGFFAFVVLLAVTSFSLFSCSNGSDGTPIIIVLPGANNATDGSNTNSGGTTQTDSGTQTGDGTSAPTTTTTTPTETGGGQTQNPTSTTYTITFNANDGSQNPATATQTFTAGTTQALKTITELGFSKEGFNFAGWLTAADATETAYADGASYTASANATLYALWSEIPVYSVNIPANEHGTVTASPATGTAGTEIMLSNSPNAGYQFASYTVTDADGGTVAVVNGKFTMPAKNVTVTATFNAIHYNINVGTFVNGSVAANPTTATIGATVTLTLSPANGYGLATLVVTDESGASMLLSGTGDSRTFTMPAKNVTVTAMFAVLPPAASGAYTKTGTITINGTQYDLVTFGLWPQTVKAATVDINESETYTVGDFTYCRGSDGQWYAKIKENAYEDYYKYSDGTTVAQSSAASYKWFKVEPIKWRVLTTDYNGTGKKLLLAESVLIGKRYDASKNNYQNSEIRKWLNSNANSAAASDHSGSGGFLKTAFTAAEQSAIVPSSVDNSARSTNPDANATQRNSGNNQYASDTPTTDKVFLLSEREATTSAYGFDVYNAYKGDGTHTESTRIRQTTDYAKASGANQSAKGSWWRLRSPDFYSDNHACLVHEDGDANCYGLVTRYVGGVVPALCVSN